MSKKSKSMLEKLKNQREKLNARIQSAEARLKTTERKKDSRRKILIGSYYLEEANKNNTWEEMKTILSQYLKRNSDRELFGLEPLAENE